MLCYQLIIYKRVRAVRVVPPQNYRHARLHHLPCALGFAWMRPPCSATSQQLTEPSQQLATRMLAVGLQERLEMPSFGTDGNRQSVEAMPPMEGDCGEPKVDIVDVCGCWRGAGDDDTEEKG